MSNSHEDQLRNLLKTYGSRSDGDMKALIDRVSHVLAGKDFCIKAHEAIARQDLPEQGFTVEDSIEYLVKSLPAEFEAAVRSRLDHNLAQGLASAFSLFKSGEILPTLLHFEAVSAEFAGQIDNHLMPAMEILRKECDDLKAQKLLLTDCNDRRGRMLDFVDECLRGGPQELVGWKDSFTLMDLGGSDHEQDSAWQPEILIDCSRLSDYVDKVVFLRETDAPTLGSLLQAIRKHDPIAFVFLGRVPEGLCDVYNAGYKVFCMAPDAIIPEGALIGSPCEGHNGTLWAFKTVSRSS